MKIPDPPPPRWTALSRLLFLSCMLIGPCGATTAHAQVPRTQIADDRARLGNSTPLIQQIDPATVRDSERAQADAQPPAQTRWTQAAACWATWGCAPLALQAWHKLRPAGCE
ncbi:hypothetical protein RAA17_01135 [Komagataeibacter rhaeticus]|nr:hypothetical protein [Komagataeibacter rhaeticus]